MFTCDRASRNQRNTIRTRNTSSAVYDGVPYCCPKERRTSDLFHTKSKQLFSSQRFQHLNLSSGIKHLSGMRFSIRNQAICYVSSRAFFFLFQTSHRVEQIFSLYLLNLESTISLLCQYISYESRVVSFSLNYCYFLSEF